MPALGAPSQAAEAMEMGADAVLVNTAIAIASDPVRMAQAFKKAIEAGREALRNRPRRRLSDRLARPARSVVFSRAPDL